MENGSVNARFFHCYSEKYQMCLPLLFLRSIRAKHTCEIQMNFSWLNCQPITKSVALNQGALGQPFVFKKLTPNYLFIFSQLIILNFFNYLC